MKYIKLFEAFDSLESVTYTSRNLGDLIEYFFEINNIKFRIHFDLDDDDITWERTYNVIDTKTGFNTFNSKDNMAKKIVNAVSYITNEFIKKYNPYIVYINHIHMEVKDDADKVIKMETMVGNKINKRARINFNFLKNLDIIKNGDYKIKYFNFIDYKFGYTACYIYKQQLELQINNSFKNLNEIDPTL